MRFFELSFARPPYVPEPATALTETETGQANPCRAELTSYRRPEGMLAGLEKANLNIKFALATGRLFALQRETRFGNGTGSSPSNEVGTAFPECWKRFHPEPCSGNGSGETFANGRGTSGNNHTRFDSQPRSPLHSRLCGVPG